MTKEYVKPFLQHTYNYIDLFTGFRGKSDFGEE